MIDFIAAFSTRLLFFYTKADATGQEKIMQERQNAHAHRGEVNRLQIVNSPAEMKIVYQNSIFAPKRAK